MNPYFLHEENLALYKSRVSSNQLDKLTRKCLYFNRFLFCCGLSNEFVFNKTTMELYKKSFQVLEETPFNKIDKAIDKVRANLLLCKIELHESLSSLSLFKELNKPNYSLAFAEGNTSDDKKVLEEKYYKMLAKHAPFDNEGSPVLKLPRISAGDADDAIEVAPENSWKVKASEDPIVKLGISNGVLYGLAAKLNYSGEVLESLIVTMNIGSNPTIKSFTADAKQTTIDIDCTENYIATLHKEDTIRLYSNGFNNCLGVKIFKNYTNAEKVKLIGNRIFLGKHDGDAIEMSVNSDNFSKSSEKPIRLYNNPIRALDANHSYVATGSSDKIVRIWPIESPERVQIIKGAQRTVHIVSLFEDILYAASWDKVIRIYDIKNMDQSFANGEVGHKIPFQIPLAYRPNDKIPAALLPMRDHLFFSLNDQHTIYQIDLRTYGSLPNISLPEGISGNITSMKMWNDVQFFGGTSNGELTLIDRRK